MSNSSLVCRVLAGCLLIVALSGCAKQTSDQKPFWQKQTLISGTDVRVRLLWQHYFKHLAIDWGNDQVELRGDRNELIELPQQCHRIYLIKSGNKLKVAFKSGKKAAKDAKTYTSVTIKVIDKKIAYFNLIISEIGLRRTYEAGQFDFSVKYNRVAIVNQLPMELYIARVLPAEMDPDHFTLEALKAQAVVARTWAMRNRRRHLRFGYNFCDSPHCQVYKGRKLVSKRAEKATKMTLGEVLTINEKVVDAFYHSTCGGNTVFVHEVWKGKPQKHLSRVEDRYKPDHRPYCAQSPYADWVVLTSLARVERILRKESVLASKEKLENIKVDFVNRSGRVMRIKLITTDGSKFMKGLLFRRYLNEAYGKRKILSSFFDVEVQGKQVKLIGHGLGHGVGMCQWGARGMAQHGFGYKSILRHYFKGVKIKKLYGPVPAGSSPALIQNSETGEK